MGINWNQGRKWKSLTKIIVFRDHYSDPKKCKKFPKKSLIKNTWFFFYYCCFFSVLPIYCFVVFLNNSWQKNTHLIMLLDHYYYYNYMLMCNLCSMHIKSHFWRKGPPSPWTYVNCQKLPFALLSIPLKQNIKSKTYTFQFIL